MTSNEWTVFVVDDDQSVLESLRLLLESAGYESRRFGSAEEFLESGSVRGACSLILDIQLSGMSGFQLKEILTASQTPIPVVLITGHDGPGMERRGLAPGAIAYLRKPFYGQALLSAIQPHCRK